MRLRFLFLLSFSVLAAITSKAQTALQPITGKTVFAKPQLPPVAVSAPIAPSLLITPGFYTENLAFFCRQEYKFQKATGINFKFRLGSVQYVDYLEGKKGAARVY